MPGAITGDGKGTKDEKKGDRHPPHASYISSNFSAVVARHDRIIQFGLRDVNETLVAGAPWTVVVFATAHRWSRRSHHERRASKNAHFCPVRRRNVLAHTVRVRAIKVLARARSSVRPFTRLVTAGTRAGQVRAAVTSRSNVT